MNVYSNFNGSCQLMTATVNWVWSLGDCNYLSSSLVATAIRHFCTPVLQSIVYIWTAIQHYDAILYKKKDKKNNKIQVCKAS